LINSLELYDTLTISFSKVRRKFAGSLKEFH
jgi:hypothetical protein